MGITLPEAYAAACKLIGEQQIQIQFMAKALQEAQAKLEQKPDSPPET